MFERVIIDHLPKELAKILQNSDSNRFFWKEIE
jgi:uncharacterized protein (DUF2249 family)